MTTPRHIVAAALTLPLLVGTASADSGYLDGLNKNFNTYCSSVKDTPPFAGAIEENLSITTTPGGNDLHTCLLHLHVGLGSVVLSSRAIVLDDLSASKARKLKDILAGACKPYIPWESGMHDTIDLFGRPQDIIPVATSAFAACAKAIKPYIATVTPDDAKILKTVSDWNSLIAKTIAP